MYLWVALGGALGSVARYWMGVRITVLTGLAFPWATILINILGSLVIGFLVTLTGPEGRVPAPLDVRAFLLVGICGGFTTFQRSASRRWISRGAGGCCWRGPISCSPS